MEIAFNKIITVSCPAAVSLTTKNTIQMSNNSIGFTPDMIILRNIAYYGDSTDLNTVGLYKIDTNITNDTICSFSPTVYYDTVNTVNILTANVSPNVHMKIVNGLNNSPTFTITNTRGNTEGYIALTLECIKYHN